MSNQFLIKKSKSFSEFNKFAIDFILYYNNISINNNEYINNPTCSNEKKKIQIGNYEIGQEIGSGAFGKVLLAKHIETQETVAIKILDKEILSQTPEDLELVQQEINILKIVKHKYIAQLYEILETSNYYFIVMEYCEGKDLMDYILKRTRLNEYEALKIFQQLINVLLYLHSQNIVHRDVKIDNMLLDRNNNLKLVDFGLSTKYYDNELLTQPCGTVVYAAPEVLVGHQYHGMLADVWSSGIVLFGMLCGFLPFCDQNDEINKQNILNGRIYLPNFLSPSVKDLLMHMLDTNPMNRYTLQEIRDHEWFNQLEVNMIPGIIIGYNKIPIDKNILKICEKFGKNKDVIEKSVKENKCDEYNALYYLLVKKLNKEGVESISDFSSKMFIDFIMNDSNVIKEDDNNMIEKNFEEENEKKNCFGMIYNNNCNNNNVKENLNKNFTLMSNYSGNDLSTRDSNKFIILNKVIGNNYNNNNNVVINNNNNINNENINKKEINNNENNNYLNINNKEKSINKNNKNEINKTEINSKKTNSNNSSNYNENKNIKIKQFNNNNNKNILVTKNDKINNKKNEKLNSKIKQIEIKNDNNKTLFKKNKPMIKEKKKKQITNYVSKSIEHKDLNNNKYELLEIQNKLQEMYKKKKNNIKKYSKINSVLFSSLNNNNNTHNNNTHNNNFNKKNLSLNSSKKNSLLNSKEKDKNKYNNKKNNKDNSISPINKPSKKFYSQKEIIEISNRLYTSNIGNNINKNNNNNTNNNIILQKNKSFNEINNNINKINNNNNNNKNKFEKISPFKKSHKLLHSEINNFNLKNNYSLIILSERNKKRNKKNNNNKNKSILNQSMDENKQNLNKYSNIINNINNITNNDLKNNKKKIEILNKNISIMKQKLLENKNSINNNNNKIKFQKLNDKSIKSNNKVLSKSILLDNKNNNIKKKFSSSNSQKKIVDEKYNNDNKNLIDENNNNKFYLIKVQKFKNSRKDNNNSNITNISKNENSSSFNNSLNKYNNNYSQYITNNYSRIYNYNNNNNSNNNNHNFNGKSIIIRNRLKPFKKTDDSFDYLSINLNNSFVNSSILNNNNNNYSFNNNNNNNNNEYYIPYYNNGPIDLSCIYFGNLKNIIKNINEKMKKKNFYSIQNKSNKIHFSKKDIFFDLEIYKLHNNNVFYFKILKKKGIFSCNLSQILN